jgi:hypothetical protein
MGRLQVAVNDAAIVQMCQPGGDPHCDPACFFIGQSSSILQPLLERPARQALDHHVRPLLGDPVVVDLHHVRMGQRGGRLRFALEPRRRRVGGEQLHRDATLELEVGCGPDFRQSAAPQKLLEPIPAADQPMSHQPIDAPTADYYALRGVRGRSRVPMIVRRSPARNGPSVLSATVSVLWGNSSARPNAGRAPQHVVRARQPSGVESTGVVRAGLIAATRR